MYLKRVRMFTVEDQSLIPIHTNPLYVANIPTTWQSALVCVQNTEYLGLTVVEYLLLRVYLHYLQSFTSS